MNRRILKLLIILDKKRSYLWRLKYYKQQGMKIGENTHIFSNIGGEPYLIEIGKNCTISTEVSFLTHDASVGTIYAREEYSDLCGKIKIGNNCFIGNKSIILYGVSLGDNTIVAAGSVVTRSFNNGVVIGGNPARILCSIEDFKYKHQENFLCLHGKTSAEKRKIILESGKLITR